MFDTNVLDEMYEENVKFGVPLLNFSLFDSRVLFPRSDLLDVVQRETQQELTLQEVDELEHAGIFKWFNGAGEDGMELGLPLYVPSRIGLCARLLKTGWLMSELKDFVEWEEWIIEDTLLTGLSYDDDDRIVVARDIRTQLEGLNEEIWGRLPAEEQPPNWTQRSWSSVLQACTLPELQAKRDRLLRYVAKIDATDLTTAAEDWKQRLGRQAYRIRARDEWIRVITILDERQKVEAGFSHAVQFSGERCVFPDKNDFTSFGKLDWSGTLSNWRFLEDPDHVPIRVPGFVLVGGKITLDGLLATALYDERVELFRLGEYIEQFRTVTSERRCANCSRILNASASNRRRYCSDQCSQAARQRAYRERQKAAILQRPRKD